MLRQCVSSTLSGSSSRNDAKHKHILKKGLAELHVLRARQDLHWLPQAITAAAATVIVAVVT
jgi:hypothetical protein